MRERSDTEDRQLTRVKEMSSPECCPSRKKHIALPPVKVIDTQEVYEEVSMLERGVTRVMG